MPWTNAQLRAFSEMLFAMGEVFNESVSDPRAELCCRALEDLPFEAVMIAAQQHLRESVYFPKPADLRQRVLGRVDDEAELAWQFLLREVPRVGYLGTPRWPDAVTQHTAEGLFGTWRALCERLPADGPELLGYRKQFVALFGATARKAIAGELGPSRSEAAAQLADITAQLKRRGLPSGNL